MRSGRVWRDDGHTPRPAARHPFCASGMMEPKSGSCLIVMLNLVQDDAFHWQLRQDFPSREPT